MSDVTTRLALGLSVIDLGLANIAAGRVEDGVRMIADARSVLAVDLAKCHAAADARGGTATDQALAGVSEYLRQRREQLSATE